MNIEPDDRMKAVDEKERLIIESMGEHEALEAITRAMSYDQKREIYDYIVRVYDLEPLEE